MRVGPWRRNESSEPLVVAGNHMQLSVMLQKVLEFVFPARP